jgi:hypothetical protein
LAKNGFDAGQVQTKIAPPAEQAEKPVAAIDGTSPDGYRIRYSADVLAGPDVAKSDAAIRGALATAQVPVGLAQSLVDTVANTAKNFANLPPDAQAAKAAQEGATLIKTFGKEEASNLGTLAEAIERAYRQKKGT